MLIRHKETGAILEEAPGHGLGKGRVFTRNLAGADLCGAKVVRTDLSGANLDGALLAGARMRGVVLRGACIRGAALAGASISGWPDMLEGVVGWIAFTSAFLIVIYIAPPRWVAALFCWLFIYALGMLICSGWRRCLGQDAKTESWLPWLDVLTSEWSDLAAADLEDANLQGARLTMCIVRDANLQRARLDGLVARGVNLTGANLNGASLRGARLAWVNLTDANMAGADLRGADLRSARLDGANLVGAVFNDQTRWPKGFDFSWRRVPLAATGETNSPAH